MSEPQKYMKATTKMGNLEFCYTMTEIGDELGVTRERVRQLQESALDKCRAWCARHGYHIEDLL